MDIAGVGVALLRGLLAATCGSLGGSQEEDGTQKVKNRHGRGRKDR